jgi:dTDP-4-dehydrorhamnose reductase
VSNARILVTGASGQLGSYLLHRLGRDRRFDVVAWSGSQSGQLGGVPLEPVDLTDRQRVMASYESARPDFIIHTAAICRIDACYADPERAERVNVAGTRLLCELASEHHARVVCVSTDLVFDGEQGSYRGPHEPDVRTRVERTHVVL